VAVLVTGFALVLVLAVISVGLLGTQANKTFTAVDAALPARDLGLAPQQSATMAARSARPVAMPPPPGPPGIRGGGAGVPQLTGDPTKDMFNAAKAGGPGAGSGLSLPANKPADTPRPDAGPPKDDAVAESAGQTDPSYLSGTPKQPPAESARRRFLEVRQ